MVFNWNTNQALLFIPLLVFLSQLKILYLLLSLNKINLPLSPLCVVKRAKCNQWKWCVEYSTFLCNKYTSADTTFGKTIYEYHLFCEFIALNFRYNALAYSSLWCSLQLQSYDLYTFCLWWVPLSIVVERRRETTEKGGKTGGRQMYQNCHTGTTVCITITPENFYKQKFALFYWAYLSYLYLSTFPSVVLWLLFFTNGIWFGPHNPFAPKLGCSLVYTKVFSTQ